MPNNQQYQQIQSQSNFIRNYLTTNSLKQFWRMTNEWKITNDKFYADSTLNELEGNFPEEVYKDDIAMIKGRIILLQGLNQESTPTSPVQENTTDTADVADIALNSISSFGITLASQGGDVRYLYEEYKLKELFKNLAKNGIEVNFKVVSKSTQKLF